MSRFEDRKKIDVNKKEDKIGKGIFFEKTENTKFIRKTYHLTEDIIKAIAVMGVVEDKEKSEIVREALKNYIPDKYFDM